MTRHSDPLAKLLCFIATIFLALSAHAQSLPQGLTCGLSYKTASCGPLSAGVPIHERIVEGNYCNGTPTLYYQTPDAVYTLFATGFSAIFDGDITNCSGTGYFHQELNDGSGAAADSTHFLLPMGTICGFHHTGSSPGHTCMGFNPSKAFTDITNDPVGLVGCPAGWLPRRAYDRGSSGPNQFWTWCEYQDPSGYSQVGFTPPVTGLTCGISDNDSIDASINPWGYVGTCMGYSTLTFATQSNCPGMISSFWLDAGAPSNVGLGFCTVGSTLPPFYTPPPPPPPPPDPGCPPPPHSCQ